MCRLFFIFDHSLKPNEIIRIFRQRTEKKSKYCLSKKDWGPRTDGMGLAYISHNKWVVRTFLINPEICGQMLLDMPKNNTENPLIIHLRQIRTGQKYSAPIGVENTHPFFHKDYVFAHNGEISNFDEKTRNLLHLFTFQMPTLVVGIF